jgi:hypothetical protein
MREKITASVVSSLLTLFIVTLVSLIRPAVVISWLGGATKSDVSALEAKYANLDERMKHISTTPDGVTLIGSSRGAIFQAGTKTFTVQADGNLAIRDARGYVCWTSVTSEYDNPVCKPEQVHQK